MVSTVEIYKHFNRNIRIVFEKQSFLNGNIRIDEVCMLNNKIYFRKFNKQYISDVSDICETEVVITIKH